MKGALPLTLVITKKRKFKEIRWFARQVNYKPYDHCFVHWVKVFLTTGQSNTPLWL